MFHGSSLIFLSSSFDESQKICRPRLAKSLVKFNKIQKIRRRRTFGYAQREATRGRQRILSSPRGGGRAVTLKFKIETLYGLKFRPKFDDITLKYTGVKMSHFFSSKDNINLLLDLLYRESRQKKKFIEDLYRKPIEQSLGLGDILGPLKVKRTKKDALVLKGEGFFSRYRKGDQVDVVSYSHSINFNMVRKSVNITEVSFPEYGQIEITTSIKKNMNSFSSNEEYYFFPSKNMSDINLVMANKIQGLKNNMRRHPHPKKYFTPIKIPNEIKEFLNKSQISALEQLACQGLSGRIQGPPGTGKTHLLKAITNLALQQNFTIGIAAFTHAAVDNAFSRIISENINASCIRVGRIGKIRKDLYQNFEMMNIQDSFGMLQNQYLVYAATLHSWALSSSRPNVDLLIIDEAGQAPIYFEPFLKEIGDRIIMLGDQKQLPPVLSAEIGGLPSEDVFSLDLSNTPMLETQYRMNSDIQSWSSKMFYDNRLKPHESVAERDIVQNQVSNGTLINNSRVTLHTHSNTGNKYANAKEASQVADLIEELNGQGGVPLSEIGVVTPYRMQAGAVCAQIQSKYGVRVMKEVVVDTVERLQGQEREVIILSLGVDEELPKRGDKTFLGDGRRLNVSVTRSKSRFYCFSSKNLKNQRSDKVPRTSYLKNFLGWCNDMTKKPAA